MALKKRQRRSVGFIPDLLLPDRFRSIGEKMERILPGVKKVHLVGIGGIGMSGLALLLKEKGVEVTGSDSHPTPTTEMLKNKGIKLFIGHSKQNLDSDTDILCHSSAISEANCEIAEARRKNIRVAKRGLLLAELCKDKNTIAVSGSHGKTTTTSLLGYLLTSTGHDPTVFIGGLPLNYSEWAWWGKDFFVVECDESDGSFLYYKPEYSIITNIDQEHMDYYKDSGRLKESFLQFALNTKRKVFGWGDDPVVRKIIQKTGGVSFGWGKNNQVRGEKFSLKNDFSYFDLYIKDKFVFKVKIPLLGKHNCINCLSVFSFFDYLGEDLNKVKNLITGFKGTRRRFQKKGKFRGVSFVDDYAHHPTEIKAVLDTARKLDYGRLIVIFEPHRFSRVKDLYREFSKCFCGVNHVFITDIYSASEAPIENITSSWLGELIKQNSNTDVRYFSAEKAVSELPRFFKERDLVISLGAGNVSNILDEVINVFKSGSVKQSC
ncbi:MAG: UDP-N-acetylmuramate--L-alanine ligase [Candidatus Omnitrophica bacterium]|nr:UDP-N-acetylmuramate--L-alanine ligase [Candidatus Omnitrophota bacterium]MBD3269536.1 UDP-N-acetylmuramate--L-alanine ligase [Candidatus Omnitrophota bacterium]